MLCVCSDSECVHTRVITLFKYMHNSVSVNINMAKHIFYVTFTHSFTAKT